MHPPSSSHGPDTYGTPPEPVEGAQATTGGDDVHAERGREERERVEAALRRAEARNRALIESLRDAYVVVAMDGTLRECNDHYCAMLGYSADELRALRYQDLTPARWHAMEERIVQEQILPRGYSDVYEKEYRRKDGTVFPVELRTVLSREPDAPPVMWAIVRDITERKRTEGALRASEERFRLALRNAPVSIAAQDQTLRYVWAYNQRSATPEEIVGHVDEELFTPEEAARLTAIKRRVLGEGAIVREQLWLDRPIGRMFVDVLWEPIHDAHGAICGVSTVTLDLTPTKLAEEAHLRSEHQLRVLIDHLSAGVALIDARGAFTLSNARFREMFGLRSDAKVRDVSDGGWGAWRVFDASGRLLELDEHPVRKAVLRRASVHDELVAVELPGGGPLRWMQVSAAPLFDEGGALECVICTYGDVTERIAAERAVRENEATLKGILDAAKESVWLFDLDGTALLGNETAIDRMGGDPNAVLGRRVRELLPPDLAEARLARLLEAAAGGPVEFEDHRDGRDFEHRFYPVRGASGQVERIAAFSRDITERKRDEARVRQVTRLYSVLSKVNEAIVRSPEPRALFARVCGILAEDREQPLAWIGQVEGGELRPVAAAGEAVGYLQGLQIPLGEGPDAAPAARCVRKGQPIVLDDLDAPEAGARGDAEPPWLRAARGEGLRSCAAFPLRRQGQEIGALTIFAREPRAFDPEQVLLLESLSADVSFALEKLAQAHALRESEAGLREADQRKNEFLAVLSHELRNPLTPIRNSLYVLERAAPDGPEARRAKVVMERQVAQLTRLVDDLLDVTRITRGKARLQLGRVELATLLQRALEDHRAQFAAAGVTLGLVGGDRPIWIEADEARIAQAVGNLLQNGVKFTPRGGHVTVTLEGDPGTGVARIRVRDDGIGIEPQVLARLFQPFMQADASLDRSRGGLGLGLALVKGLVELHGGSVSARSDGLGHGAELELRLPLAVAPRGPATPIPMPTPFGARRVLIVEDHEDAAESLRDYLELRGHAVEIAIDGLDALAKAATFRPEIVLCDLGLPGLDGYGVARALRADPALRGAFLVALSGYAQDEDVARSREAGFDRHLAKPADPVVLEALMATLPERPR
jgi:PAS domain S-box-containing protein